MLICVIGNCANELDKRGMCTEHYEAWRTGKVKTLDEFTRRPGRPETVPGCLVAGCVIKPHSRSLCSKHYNEQNYVPRPRKRRDYTGLELGKVKVLRLKEPRHRAMDQVWICTCTCSPGVEFERSHNKMSESKGSSTCGKCFIHEPESVITNQQWRVYSQSAKSRGLAWELTRENVAALIFGKCSYCGMDDKEKHGVKYVGIDRVNNDRGYTLDNTVPCCWQCNAAKRGVTENFWKIWREGIANTIKKDLHYISM